MDFPLLHHSEPRNSPARFIQNSVTFGPELLFLLVSSLDAKLSELVTGRSLVFHEHASPPSMDLLILIQK